MESCPFRKKIVPTRYVMSCSSSQGLFLTSEGKAAKIWNTAHSQLTSDYNNNMEYNIIHANGTGIFTNKQSSASLNIKAFLFSLPKYPIFNQKAVNLRIRHSTTIYANKSVK